MRSNNSPIPGAYSRSIMPQTDGQWLDYTAKLN